MKAGPSFRRQRGVMLILLFLVLFSGASAVALKALSHQNPRLRETAGTLEALQASREILLAYALTLPENTNPVLGPGRLPCPDTNNNGRSNTPCALLGRMPQFDIMAPGGRTFFGDFQSGLDRQFWYALSPGFSVTASGLNSNRAGTFSLDGETDIVAVLIAPGPALGNQTRPGNQGADYLELGNRTGPDYSRADSLDSELINDLIVPIRRRELMTLVTARVARAVQLQLDVFHQLNARYPDATEFYPALSGAAPWLLSDNWNDNSVTVYTPDAVSPENKGVLTFTAGCAIAYTLVHGAAISRLPNQC